MSTELVCITFLTGENAWNTILEMRYKEALLPIIPSWFSEKQGTVWIYNIWKMT